MGTTKQKMKKKLSIATFIVILFLAVFLRLYKLDTLTTPYWEEVALGYDAYSISQNFQDHHGNFMPLVAFESFGDWKPSLYFYTIVPFIKLFDLSVLAVRFPSFLAGIMTVLGVFYLIKQITTKKHLKEKPYLPYLGMFVTAISPWAIMFSRAGWEVNLATALILWGINLFIFFTKKKETHYPSLLSSILLLVLATYTYHAARIVAPMIGLMLVFLWFAQKSNSVKISTNIRRFFDRNINTLVIAGFIAIVLISPLLMNMTSNTTTKRFKETSLFSELSIIEESNLAKELQPNILGKVFYHRYLLYGREVAINFFDHFRIDFLFVSGDENVRHSSQYFGQLYHIEFFFLFLGAVFITMALRKIKNDPYPLEFKNYLWFLIGWLFITIIPASITKTTPHSLRILPSLPVFMVIITYGIDYSIEQIKTILQKINIKNIHLGKVLLNLIIIAYLLELAIFWRHYTLIYPVDYANEWQDGYEQMVKLVNKNDDGIKPIYITREQGRPAMYYWFFSKTDPRLVQDWDTKAKMDQGEYLEFENIKFVNSLNEVTEVPALVIGSPGQIKAIENKFIESEIEEKELIRNKKGEEFWVVAKLK